MVFSTGWCEYCNICIHVSACINNRHVLLSGSSISQSAPLCCPRLVQSAALRAKCAALETPRCQSVSPPGDALRMKGRLLKVNGLVVASSGKSDVHVCVCLYDACLMLCKYTRVLWGWWWCSCTRVPQCRRARDCSICCFSGHFYMNHSGSVWCVCVCV